MKTAIGYIRVSSEDQADSGLGLAAQRQRIEAYCQMKGLRLGEIFEDAAVSGAHPAETRSTAVCRSAWLPARRSASGSGYPASIRTCRRQLSTSGVISINLDIVRGFALT